MYHYTFLIKEPLDRIQVEKNLKRLGAQDFYWIDEEGSATLGAFSQQSLDVAQLPDTLTLLSEGPSDVDWEKQWAMFAPSCEEGRICIDLSLFKENALPILLKSGGGFGNLSHPTTRLMLHLLGQETLKDVSVVDVGCGSGILSLAAYALGAETVLGIDIDSQAIKHSIENQRLNQIPENKILFTDQKVSYQKPYLVLMNMIRSEQMVAWGSLSELHPWAERIITSGILEEDKENYLELASRFGWTLLESLEEEGWLGFVFKGNQTRD